MLLHRPIENRVYQDSGPIHPTESDRKLGKQFGRLLRSKFLEQLYSAREVPVSDVDQPEVEGAQAPAVQYLDEPALLHQFRTHERRKLSHDHIGCY